MSIKCECIDLIIPISNIDNVYPGGFEQYKSDFAEDFGGRLWHDEFLFRDGAMNSIDIQLLVNQWEKLGLKGIIKIDGKKKWKDFCIVQSIMGGPTLPCDWIDFDPETITASYLL